ncbi:MAG: hypothetical protein L6Q99_16755 [Planctomycetes bacterium]|nr:hypothetical protein [Planctomycetota bacterium]
MTRSMARASLAAAAVAVSFVPTPARAQSAFFAPRTDEFRVNASPSFNQFWVRADVDSSGTTWALSFVAGLDPVLRLFDLDGNPLTGNLGCTPTLNQGTQDEAEVCVDRATGNILVAWSERFGYDGEQMGIFGRLFGPTGTPLGNEFQINQTWQASQWRPLMTSPPTGGFLVAWSGDWDADNYFRLLDSNGQFLSGDIPINVFTNGGQADCAPAIAPDGTIFFAFVDYGQHGGGPGLNLWGRTFDAQGNALQPGEFFLTSAGFSSGDQREPRVAADGLGRFVVVWEDSVNEGQGWGVAARRFDLSGAPLGGEFWVPSTTAGTQRNARVVADAAGTLTFVWEDWSSGSADVRTRRFDANGVALGNDVVVNEVTGGDQVRPSLALAPNGEDVLFTWEGPGVSTDAWARFFATYQFPEAYCTAKTNSLGCVPQIASSGTPSLSGPDDFFLGANQVLNNKFGVFFWSVTGATAIPFGGGTLCVKMPVTRSGVLSSGGNPPPDDCTGSYSFHFSQAYVAAKGLGAGDTIYGQFWSRDPGFTAPNNIGLSDALRFEIRP